MRSVSPGTAEVLDAVLPEASSEALLRGNLVRVGAKVLDVWRRQDGDAS